MISTMVSRYRKLSLARFSIVVLSLSVLFSLSACSQTGEMSHLRNEYKNYKNSSYVKDNLKAQPVDTKAQTAEAQQAAKDRKSLKAVQRQLENKKTHYTAQIRNTIQRNDLFTPTQGLQRQVSALQGRESFENWLKKHATLPAVLTLALKNNLDIQSSLQQTQASLEKYDQVSFLDDTLAQYAAFTKDLAVPVGKKKNKSVANGFPFPGIMGLKASIIDQAVESSRLRLKQTVQDTITQTRIAYYELQLAKQELGVLANEISLLRSLKDQLQDSYSTSTTELGNILQVDVEVEKNRNRYQITKNTITAKQARLNALLNLSPTFMLGKIDKLRPVKVTKNVQSLLQLGKQRRIEIAQLQTDLKKMEKIIQLSEKRFYPDFSAGYSRFQNQTSKQTGSNATKAAFSTRPGFKKRNFFGTNDAYLKETKSKYKALQAKLNALRNKTEGDIQQTLADFQAQKRSHTLYQSKIIPTSKTAFDITKNLFVTSDSSYLQLIDIKRTILEYRLLSLKAVKGMNVDTAKLSRFVGQSSTGD